MNQSVVAIQRKTKIEAIPPMRRRSAARLPSLARYGVRAVDRCIETQWLVAKPRTLHLHCAAPAVLQAANPAMQAFLWGIKRGYSLLRKRIPPFSGSSAKCCTNSCSAARCNPPSPPARGGNKKRALSRIERRSLLLASVNLTDTSACRRWRGRGHRRRRS